MNSGFIFIQVNVNQICICSSTELFWIGKVNFGWVNISVDR